MQVTIVGETVHSAKLCAKAPESQADAGGFDMAMAAVMALLMPNSGEPPPAPNQMAGETVVIPSLSAETQKTADLVTQQGVLPGALAFDASEAAGTPAQAVAVEEAQPPPQIAQADKMSISNPVPNAGSELMQQEPAQEYPDLRLANLVPDSSKKGLGSSETADQSLFAKAADPGGIKDKTQIVTAVQNINANAEGDAVGAAPSGLESSGEKSAPVKTVPVSFTPEANAQAAAAKANMVIETVQSRSTGAEGTEGKGNVVLSELMEVGGAGSTGEAKNESGGFNNSPGTESQPSPGQVNAAGSQPGSARYPGGVSLTDLRDVVAQEIKHLYATRKGEPAHIQIRLEPENLGKLTIKVSYSNGELNAHFYTGSDHVKGILEASIGQLRESLGQQELTLNQAFVFVGDDNSGGTGRQMEFGNRQAEFFPDRHSGHNYSQSKMESDDYYQPGTDFSGVNYLI